MILKCKTLFIQNKRKNYSEKTLYSKIKSLNTVFLTNNICETIHQRISNCLSNSTVTKTYFRDALTYVLNNYTFKNSETIRKDYITRSIIIMIYKYGLNNYPKFGI